MHAGNGVRALLQGLASGDPDDVLCLGDILQGLGRRSFGMLLLVATLPAFIPVPIGGAVSGPLVMLVGLQLLAWRRRPWLPGFLARRGPHRHSVARFERRLSPWLERLERIVRPRLRAAVSHPAAAMFTGLLLLLLGLLLALPIPLTNYLFGGLLLLFAFALLERDGGLMLACWGLGLVAIGVFGAMSGGMVAVAGDWLTKTF